MPSHPPLYISITCCVDVWFCWSLTAFEPPPWEVGECLTTVCGFGFVSCWEIYAQVCICFGDGGQRVMVFAPPTVRSWEQVAVAKFF